jgi:hypothetical protein
MAQAGVGCGKFSPFCVHRVRIALYQVTAAQLAAGAGIIPRVSTANAQARGGCPQVIHIAVHSQQVSVAGRGIPADAPVTGQSRPATTGKSRTGKAQTRRQESGVFQAAVRQLTQKAVIPIWPSLSGGYWDPEGKRLG